MTCFPECRNGEAAENLPPIGANMPAAGLAINGDIRKVLADNP
jgi:hypothetical protein